MIVGSEVKSAIIDKGFDLGRPKLPAMCVCSESFGGPHRFPSGPAQVVTGA
jgi:hypothetical protein